MAKSSRDSRSVAPVFDPNPIPKELEFPQFEKYLLPLKYEVYPDMGFVSGALVHSFEQALKDITNSISQFESDLTATKEQVSKLGSKIVTVPCEKNFLNTEVWSQYYTLYSSYISIESNIAATRFSIISNRLDTLKHLQPLVTHLAEHPKYFHISYEAAIFPWRKTEFDLCPSLFFKHRAFKLKLQDLRQQLAFIPMPFQREAECQDLINSCIEAGIILRDPQTLFVPYIDEYELFARFLESKQSPLCLKDIGYTNDQEISSFIPIVTKTICVYAQIPQDDREKHETVASFCARAIFDVVTLKKNARNAPSRINYHSLEKMSKMKVRDAGFKAGFLGDLQEMTVCELFSSSQLYESAFKEFSSIGFVPNPIDVSNIIFKVNLTLSAILVTINSSIKMEDEKANESLIAFWSLLIVATKIPGIDSIIHELDTFKSVPGMPSVSADCVKYPLSAIKTFESL